ncbi:MAG: DUF1232 domain-containing protein [Bacteroidales bacterium]|nr:DUF1232 domain-containing protein [Bacteroidales bacterium]
MKAPRNLEKYIPNYDVEKFWKKLRRSLRRMGAKAVYYALLLYYALQDPQISRKDKGMILGALGYFLLPLDLMPDFLPAIGYTDDIAALAFAVYKVINCITPLVKGQAEAKVYEWFGDVDQSDLIL